MSDRKNPTLCRELYETWNSLRRQAALADAKEKSERAERELAVAVAYYDWAVEDGKPEKP